MRQQFLRRRRCGDFAGGPGIVAIVAACGIFAVISTSWGSDMAGPKTTEKSSTEHHREPLTMAYGSFVFDARSQLHDQRWRRLYPSCGSGAVKHFAQTILSVLMNRRRGIVYG